MKEGGREEQGRRDPIGFSATEASRPRVASLLIFPLFHFLKKAEFGSKLAGDFGAVDDRTFTN